MSFTKENHLAGMLKLTHKMSVTTAFKYDTEEETNEIYIRARLYLSLSLIHFKRVVCTYIFCDI